MLKTHAQLPKHPQEMRVFNLMSDALLLSFRGPNDWSLAESEHWARQTFMRI